MREKTFDLSRGINRTTFTLSPRIKRAYRIPIILAVLSILLAIPMCLRDQLHMEYPAWYWANSGNIFTDWSIYYLDFIPFWVIFSVVWLSPRPSFLFLVKWFVFFMLGYWLFYDWTWWFLVLAISPGMFSWTAPFYFDIIIHDSPMWFFLVMSIVGFLLSLLMMSAIKRSPWFMLPFIVYLGYIYGLGGITEVMNVEAWFYIAWSAIFLPLIACIAIFSIYKYKRKKSG